MLGSSNVLTPLVLLEIVNIIRCDNSSRVRTEEEEEEQEEEQCL